MTETYLNPVLNRSAPDPFVFKHRGEYWCISTHSGPRQRKFEMLRSPDLVHWQVMGGALEPLAEDYPYYWAPKITYLNGVFHLYYSVGSETLMQLRVATSRNPGGPYIDKGIRLTKEDFAIDAHGFMAREAKGGVKWLETLPGPATGPGHNSVVRGPDNRQMYCVYHRWVDDSLGGAKGRVLAIDRLDWTGDRLLVLGPSHTPQAAPIPPTIRGFDAPGPYAAHLTGGRWQLTGDEARQTSVKQRSEARWELPAPQFTLEVTLRAEPPANGAYGVVLIGERNRFAQFGIRPADGVLLAAVRGAQRGHPLPADFDPTVDHLLRCDVDGRRVTLMLDNLASRWRLKLPFEPFDVAVFTDGLAATFAAPEITLGWEELFDGPETSAADLDWEGDEGWTVADGGLRSPDMSAEPTMIAKMVPAESYELVVNVRLVEAAAGGGYGIAPALSADHGGPLVTVERTADGWALTAGGEDAAPGEDVQWPLPHGFAATAWQQWRLRVQGGRVAVALEGQPVGELALSRPGTHVGVAASGARVACEMVRVTTL